MAYRSGTIYAACLIVACQATPAIATDTTAPSGSTGSGSVLIEGKPARRAGDIPGAIISPDVMINGQPVIIGCSEGTPVLSKSVFVNGKPKILGCEK